MFRELYEVSIWFKNEGDNPKTKKTFFFSKIVKITPKHIKAKDRAGKRIEIRTAEPMDYYLQKLKQLYPLKREINE